MVTKFASVEQENGFLSLREKLDCHDLLLRIFFATNAEFRDICEHYGIVLCALEAWSKRPEVAHQFHCIAVEIEMEVENILSSRSDVSGE